MLSRDFCCFYFPNFRPLKVKINNYICHPQTILLNIHRRRKRGGAGGGQGGGGGGRGGQAPPNNLRGGANIPFGPPNNPPTFSFNFYVKQEKITNVPN